MIGILNFILKTKKISLKIKIYQYLSIPINLVLWNAEIKSANTANMQLLGTFYYEEIYKILNTNIIWVNNNYTKIKL